MQQKNNESFSSDYNCYIRNMIVISLSNYMKHARL